MSGFSERRNQDVNKLNQLSKESGGKIQVLSTVGNPISKIVVKLIYPTAVDSNYPKKIQPTSTIVINLSSRYPFDEPTVSFEKPIVFHPNIYSSGRICFGTKWLPTEGLDLLVKRVIKIITFDADILNEQSPANTSALNWYRKAVNQYSSSFPTTKNININSTTPKMSWNNL